MEVLYFILGFFGGIILTCGAFYFSQKKIKSEKDEIALNLQLQFENLANKIFKESTTAFTEENKQKLTEFFAPFKQQLEGFENRLQNNFNEEVKNLSMLQENIKQVVLTGNQISKDSNRLSNALSGDLKVQGKWGELILERVLEISGLRKDSEYFLQKKLDMGIPDATIVLPENKIITIDAKTSLAYYEQYVNEENPEEKIKCLNAFKQSVKNHIKELAKRDYTETKQYETINYVLMFIPVESCYSLIFSQDAEIWDYAWNNNIMPVSPSTLLASLKIINSFFVISRQNKNAKEIARISGKMIDKFADMLKDLLNARKNIISAFKKLDGKDNILINIEKLQDLGANATKTLAELPEDLIEEVKASG